MGYVGNQTTSSFTSMDKQVITGDGGTGYTLSHAVANAQEIEVFVNNVRQEPAVAYTATGTTLTMTGNVASTDDFYVVYQGKAVQTVVPPDGSVTSAKIADDAVTSAKLDTNIAIAGSLSTVGRLGVGTTSPPDHLSVVTSGSNAQLSVDRSDGASGRTVLIHSSTGGQLQTTGSVPLLFGTADTERCRVDTAGNLLIGRTVATSNTGGHFITPSYGFFENDGTPFFINRYNSNGDLLIFRKNNSGVGSISTNGSSTAYNTSSDYRLKTAVTYDWDATTRLKQLKPARFKWIADGDDAVLVDGFLAHECGAVPESVTGTKDEIDADGNPVMQGIDQSKLVPLLCKTILELEARITALEAN